MGFRFFRRIKIAPGVTLNFSKSGVSTSIGPRGAKVTVGGPRGTRTTVGIPGTGIHYTEVHGTKKRTSNRATGGSRRYDPPPPQVDPTKRLTLGFFQRLVTPKDEEAVVDGMREYTAGKLEAAYAHLCKATHLADGAFLAGMIAIRLKRFDEAVTHLKSAAGGAATLGQYFHKYGVDIVVTMPVTSHIWAHIEPTEQGALLALVEIYQDQREYNEALSCLKRLVEINPYDPLPKLSMCELLYEAAPHDRKVCQEIVKHAEGFENDSDIHAALLLYKAKALHNLGLTSAARDLLTATLRRKKNRPADLLKALQYERALVYQTLGQHGRARTDFERIYAESPDYEDVAEKLGLK